MTTESDSWSALLEAYMSGTLDEEQRKLFMHCLSNSEEARNELASVVGTERLLRAMGSGPVPIADIMYAVMKEQPAPKVAAPVPVARPEARSKSYFWPIVAAASLLAAVGLTGYVVKQQRSSSNPDVVGDKPVPKQVVNVSEDPVEKSEKVAAVQDVEPVARALVEDIPFQAFPLEAPVVDVEADPPGDGSDQAGFVPLPSIVEQAIPLLPRDPSTPAPPVLISKITLGLDAAPNDIECLLRHISGELKLDYSHGKRSLEELSDDPSGQPVLYFSSHYHVELSRDQQNTLRRFVLNGGMLIMNAGGGSKPAYESARRRLAAIFPELSLQRLSPDHPIYHAYYDLENPPALDGLTLSCRTAVILVPDGIAARWQSEDPVALQLGVDLVSYATAVRAWVKRSAHTRSFVGRDTSQGDKLFMAQIEHRGDWRTRYTGLPNLLYSYNQRTEVPVKFDIKSLPLTDPGLFNHPLLYLTGHEPLQFNAREIVALRRYLENGGFLLAEACCGRAGFDQSFRRLMRQLFPKNPLSEVPSDSALFKTPNAIDLLGLTQSLGAKQGSMLMRPRLEGIQFGEQYGVIYSPYGMAGGWEMSQTPYADGYEDPDTLKLGQNILHYAITQ